jgi:hypothetical protein
MLLESTWTSVSEATVMPVIARCRTVHVVHSSLNEFDVQALGGGACSSDPVTGSRANCRIAPG